MLRTMKGCLVLLGCAAACTGAVQGDAGGTTGSSTEGVGPSGTLVAACPSSPPANGASCSEPGELDCEYGTDWDPLCNTIAQCWRGGPLDSTWQLQEPATGFPCPTPASLAAVCPPTQPPGGDCPAAASGSLCAYPSTVCGCVQLGDTPDASATWICAAPGTGCPDARPRIGSPCQSNSQNDDCMYAVCGIGGVTSCSSGIWREGVLISHCE